MHETEEAENLLVVSYLSLRKAVGAIGISLPFVLVLGQLILFGSGLQSSISGYYYTGMRDVFVGSLFAIAVFLMSYRGYEQADSVAGNLAGIFAIGMALLPTSPSNGATPHQNLIGEFHLAFAFLLFMTLAFFALVLFRKTDPTKRPTPQKLKRNMVYTVCGIGILASIFLIVIIRFLPSDSPIFAFTPVFWLESLAIIFFGVSWFVKGEAILKDGGTSTMTTKRPAFLH